MTVDNNLVKYVGKELMLGANNEADIGAYVVDSNIGTTSASKYVVIKGCHAKQYITVPKPSQVPRRLTAKFTKIKNPYSVR